MGTDARERILERLRLVACEVPGDALDAVACFYELLFRWNRSVNLTALADGDEAIDRLVVEPLVAGQLLPSSGLLVDVGSGGGSPAIPLKLLRPRMELLMVESRARKGAFLREVVRQLGLAGVGVETRRLEDVAKIEAYAGRADVVSLRAVRLDAPLLRAIQRVGAREARLWVFGRLSEAGGQGPEGWALERSLPLVPARGSGLGVFRRAQVFHVEH